MVQILEFKGKDMSSTQTESLVKEILKGLIKEADNISDLIVISKYNNDEVVLFHSGPSLADKSFAVMLLEHDIHRDIDDAEDELVFTPEGK